MTTKTSSNSDALLELAERCEAATEGSVGLNWACHAAKIGKPRPNRDELNEAPDYTRSVDAALTLVPEGWVWRHEPTKHVPHMVSVAERYSRGGWNGHSDHSAALAICAAALRARAAQ